MLKKSLSIPLLVVLMFIVSSFSSVSAKQVNKTNINTSVELTTKSRRVKAMDTTITMMTQSTDELFDQSELFFDEAELIIKNINNLTDNFRGYDNVNNVYYINNNVNKKIEIDKELYKIIEEAEKIKIKTDGYFDISIGKIIDEWKRVINTSPKLTDKEFKEFVKNVKEIPVIENGISLENANDKYYITIKDGVKIDLGAYAKGYVVEEVYQYFKSKGFKYFQLAGSQSSLQYGINGREGSNDFYRIAVSNPEGGRAGILEVKNTSISTSGDTFQGTKYNDRIYHHIISPKTKMPEAFNRLLTVVHEDAGYSDALTTALFSMPDKVRENWIKNNGDIEHIVFKTNGKIDHNLKNFELEEGDVLKTTARDWIIISSIIVIFGLGFFMFSKAFKKVKYNQSTVVVEKQTLVVIHFSMKKVEVVKNQDNIPSTIDKQYPIINEEKQTITVLGQEKIHDVRQEVEITYNFENRSMEITNVTCPDKLCQGVTTGMEKICIPNDVRISFQNGNEEVDGIV